MNNHGHSEISKNKTNYSSVSAQDPDFEIRSSDHTPFSGSRSVSLKKHSLNRSLSDQNCSNMPPAVYTVESQGGEVNRGSKSFVINRPVYTQEQFDSRYGSMPTQKTIPEQVRSAVHKAQTSCHKEQCKRFAFRIFPFINIMRKYKFGEWFINDLISGITVGIMHIPQGMAYAMLATLPPVHGLYTSFFPALIYFFFGTSRHISIGTVAVVSLMTGTVLDEAMGDRKAVSDIIVNQTGNDTGISDDMNARISLAFGVTMIVGLIQIAFGLLHLGFLTRYLSDPMISGFTVGVAVHVFTSQIKYIFGLHIKKHQNAFSVPKTYYEIFSNIHKTNLITMGISFISILLLIVFKEWINPLVRAKIKIPIPIELFIVIAGTMASYFLKLGPVHNVTIVGNIPKGMPTPIIPDLGLVGPHIGKCFAIAIIAFSICLSLGKIFGKKHAYEINANQEFLAYGISNFISSFFRCQPSASSLSRSSVQESMGGKTQLVTIFSCTLLLFILLFIGPLFESVPNCCLAAIIVVALKGMFIHVKELSVLWKFSCWDFWNWLLTCAAVIILAVDYGLLIGICFSVFSVILRTQSPVASILGRVQDTDIYKCKKAYSECREIEGIKIFRYEGALFYACAEHFRETLYHKTLSNPRKILLKNLKVDRKLKHVEKALARLSMGDPEVGGKCSCLHPPKSQVNETEVRYRPNHSEDVPQSANGNALVTTPDLVTGDGAIGELEQRVTEGQEGENAFEGEERGRLEALKEDLLLQKRVFGNPTVHHIILDCSTWGYIDFMGVRTLNQVIQEYKEISVSIFLANPKVCIRENLERLDFYKLNDRNIIYVSVHDAVIAAKFERKVSIMQDHVSGGEETRF